MSDKNRAQEGPALVLILTEMGLCSETANAFLHKQSF
jgi:hypothetical protein